MRTYLVRAGLEEHSEGCGHCPIWRLWPYGGGMGVIDGVCSRSWFSLRADLPVGNPFFLGRGSRVEKIWMITKSNDLKQYNPKKESGLQQNLALGVSLFFVYHKIQFDVS
jgi:hypothetical protein